ncbi:MAG: thiamine-phosphate kinase [Burkholderiaceae bacterium]
MPGEFDLIARHFTRTDPKGVALLGVGDDCALLKPARGALAVSTDMLLEGRHFFPEVDPQALGHKALAVNLSDLAAMGARPVAFTLALALPTVDDAWLAGLARGLFTLADAHGCELIGGDTTRGPLALCLTVMGEVEPDLALRRDGAHDGDDLWVSGSLGGAAWAVAHRQATGGWARPASVESTCFESAIDRLHRPQPRVSLGLALLGLASAAIDLSDGLAGDLGHVLKRSSEARGHELEALIELERLPLHAVLAGLPEEHRWRLALAGGDDYELLFTAPASRRSALNALGDRLGLDLTRIGRIQRLQDEAQPANRQAGGLRLIDRTGRLVPMQLQAHDHFKHHEPGQD